VPVYQYMMPDDDGAITQLPSRMKLSFSVLVCCSSDLALIDLTCLFRVSAGEVVIIRYLTYV